MKNLFIFLLNVHGIEEYEEEVIFLPKNGGRVSRKIQLWKFVTEKEMMKIKILYSW
jgi:hypothetical protein